MLNEKLLIYLDMLIEKNKHMNLTAIRERADIIEKHFEDSMLLNDLIKDAENIIDIGTGAGFPGLVLAILNPDKNFLLVDSIKKKVAFLDEVIEKLELKNVKTSTKRAEELINDYREYFDVGLCRGVANLRVILEYEIPFLKVNGIFLAQKQDDTEVENSKNAMKLLDCKLEKIHEFKLPKSKDRRVVIQIRKIKKTNMKYPRKVGIPSKNPL